MWIYKGHIAVIRYIHHKKMGYKFENKFSNPSFVFGIIIPNFASKSTKHRKGGYASKQGDFCIGKREMYRKG